MGRGAIVFGLSVYWTVCFYIFMIYMPTYTRIHAELTPTQAAVSNTIASLVIAVLIPLFGGLSDRYGRRPFLLASCIAVMVLTLPAFWLIAAVKSFALVVLIQACFGIAIALYSGPCPALFAELFPTQSRSSWPAVAYALAVAVFGGFAPSIAVWLTQAFDNPVAPAAYVLSAAVVSLAVLLSIGETAHRPIAEGWSKG
jgi:MHS family proline/betaine transporter-like MFS transporter